MSDFRVYDYDSLNGRIRGNYQLNVYIKKKLPVHEIQMNQQGLILIGIRKSIACNILNQFLLS